VENLEEIVNYGAGVQVVAAGLTQNAVAEMHQKLHF
jgi:hypothetical protein